VVSEFEAPENSVVAPGLRYEHDALSSPGVASIDDVASAADDVSLEDLQKELSSMYK
jgi:hypothetical protein